MWRKLQAKTLLRRSRGRPAINESASHDNRVAATAASGGMDWNPEKDEPADVRIAGWTTLSVCLESRAALS
jgi:hypothetical protein